MASQVPTFRWTRALAVSLVIAAAANLLLPRYPKIDQLLL